MTILLLLSLLLINTQPAYALRPMASKGYRAYEIAQRLREGYTEYGVPMSPMFRVKERIKSNA